VASTRRNFRLPASSRRWLAALACVSSLLAPARASAQAFTAPQGVGSVTIASQVVDNTGHRGSDGFLVKRGQSMTASALFDIEYAVTDRLSANFSLPYVFARYTGALPPPSRLPVDECRCWHSSFQDVSIGARYRLGDDTWAVTPLFRYDRPSHDYAYQGEAVVGRDLSEAQIGVNVGWRLVNLLPRASVQAGYTYAFVDKAIQEIKIDRSNGYFDFGYALRRSVFLRGTAAWQRTHGGLRAGSQSGNPFPLPGELNTPERFAQRDRLLRTRFWQLGGGLSYATGPVDVFASVMKYVWGHDAHNGQAYTVGATWYFDISK
jgi:hypothetical protein